MCASREAARANVWVGALLAALASSAGAQDVRAFSVGYTSVGPTAGTGALGAGVVALGARIEHGVKALPDFGNGVLGIEVSADVYERRPSSGATPVRYVPVGVTANYHFILSVRQLDPFVGAGLSDRFASPSNGAGSGQADRVSFLGRAGARWGAGSLLWLYAEADTGPPWLNGGVMLTFR